MGAGATATAGGDEPPLAHRFPDGAGRLETAVGGGIRGGEQVASHDSSGSFRRTRTERGNSDSQSQS